MEREYLKGRGAQLNTDNPYLKQRLSDEHVEGVDEPLHNGKKETQIFFEENKTFVNQVNSPDLGFMYSANPYQGCEHGCVYCYARNTHEYWGFSAGTDFETKIIVKKNAPALLENYLTTKKGAASPIVFSGNTDCYQPLEQEFELTRQCLQIALNFQHPVSVITKNSLILRDTDILRELAKNDLIHVYISITSLDESLRRNMEPRTASHKKKFQVIEKFNEAGIPVGVMIAPIIPGLNDHEIPAIVQKSAEAGARNVGYTVLRLNGRIESVFKDWLLKNYPDRFNKVIKQTEGLHEGSVKDNEFFRRMKGEGPVSQMISSLFKKSKQKYLSGRTMPPFNLTLFRQGGNYRLF